MGVGGSGSKSSSSSQQSQAPGSFSPALATLFSLFGGAGLGAQGYVPSAFGGEGAAFRPEMFSALPGLLTNIPQTPSESAILEGGQAAGLGRALGADRLLGLGAEALPALLQTEPTAAIAAARRGFTQETIPAILERAPGFSSSDLQRELTRAGTDLETGIAALREANLGRVGQTVAGLPAFAEAVGTGLVNNLAQVLGFGTLGRDFMREVSPAGDAFRVLSALSALSEGPALVQFGQGTSKSKSKSGGASVNLG